MTREEFKKRWESDEDGGGITFEEIAECAVSWGICQRPKTRPMREVANQVLIAAGCEPISRNN